MSRHPYNAAYVTVDRSHLYGEFDVDPSLDAGELDPDTGEVVPPRDYRDRYRAVLEFYGHRCGRCGHRLAPPGSDDGALGRAFSVAGAGDHRWALSSLVALCPHCYDLVDATDPGDVGTVCTRFREAPQFPSWHCDPRVAVERAPLTGRELFYREQLGEEEVGAQRFDFGANDDVATAAVLALDTPASVAVAFGERLTADAHGWSADEQSPFQAWSDLPPRERLAYERRALDPDAIARSDEWRRRRSSTEFPEGWEQIGLVRR